MHLLLLLLLGLLHNCSGDLASERAQLLRFYDAVASKSSNRHLGWNRSSSSGPCDWRGIECSSDTNSTNDLSIHKIRLPGVGLEGRIPEGSLSSLPSLRVLSLRSNRLTGAFPDLRNCSQMKAVYLQENRFTGELPPDFSIWPRLTHLNVAYNTFNGSISATINDLHQLGSLSLENNTLSGGLSPQLNLPALRSLNLSNNNLSGPVPASIRNFSASAFLGNSFCGPPLARPCPVSEAPAPAPGLAPVEQRSKGKKKRLSAGAIAGIVLGSIALAAILLLCCWLFCSRRRKQQQPQVIVRNKVQHSSVPEAGAAAGAGGDVSSKELEDYSSSRGDLVPNKLVFFDAARRSSYDLEDLLRASAEVLGKGTIGTTYKAVLEDGSVVAVKRLKEVTAPRERFDQQMHIIGSFRHRNVVPLRAYYYSKDEKLLVSDYMPRGSLSALLHGNRGAGRTPLDWTARIRIAYGAAKGLAHLHDHPSGFVHGSIKSSNILLAKDFEACISDAGLVPLLNPSGASSSSSKVIGYRAPEVAETRRTTQKSDVYSYGVVLLELLTGRAPGQASLNEEGIDLPRWVQSVVREEWTAEVFDLELMRYENIEDDLVQMLQLALNCTSASPDHRPNMKQVVNLIQELGARVDVEDRRTSDPSDDKSTSDVSDTR